MAKKKNKRGHGEGCITKRKDGTWAAAITVGKNPDGSQKRRFFYGKTRQEVAEKLNAALSDLSTGSYVDPNRLAVKEWLHTWLFDYKYNSLKPKTLESYNFIIETYLKPNIGNYNLQELKPENIQLLINKLVKSSLSPRTVKYCHTILRASLEHAVKLNLIMKNSADHIVLPRQTKKQAKVLTIEQQNALLSSMKGHKYETAFLLLITTGMRIGELLALRWKNVDLEGLSISITENMQRVKVFDEDSESKTKLVFGTPKTEKGKRTIPIFEEVAEMIKIHHSKQDELKRIAGELYKDEDLVFCTELGEPVDPNNFTRRFTVLLKKAGLPAINIHALRHTFATRGIENGISLKIMQEILGHSSVTVTGDIYSHVLPNVKRESLNKLKDVFNVQQPGCKTDKPDEEI